MSKAWNELIPDEEDFVEHQAALLDRAVSGRLTEEALNAQLRDYWLNGVIGRAYVLGAEMFGAIYAAFGKPGALSVMEDPRLLFQMYNRALDAEPDLLRRCPRIPDRTVKQALTIGRSQ
jgi:Putative zinc dependent peptidase (DUF5700)